MCTTHDQWVATNERMAKVGEFSPTELKAQAMAMTVMGLSSRQIEKRLNVMFPGKEIPPWGTIARWARSRPANRIAALKWFDVASRAGEIVLSRMDHIESERLSLMELIEFSSKASDLYYRSQEARTGFFDRALRQ
jgi:hypothetical protein